MSDARSDVESKTANEVQASTSSAEQQNPVRAIEPVIDQSSSSMLKLDIDCLEELFEWLSIAELLALRPTCKRLKRAVDYFIRENYPTIRIGFGRVVLSSYQDKFNKFRCHDAASLKLVKQITVWLDNLKTEDIDTFKGVLHQVESFQISAYTVEGGFYESILKLCTNLSYLSIHQICGNQIADEENEWLYRQYPAIKHIELDDRGPGGPGDGGKVIELKKFFELNPNIHTFSTTFHFFLENRDCWLGSNIKLDRLDLQGDCYYENGMDRICDFLNILYDEGFYKRLHMYPTYLNEQNEIDHITSVKGLEKLYLSCIGTDVILSPMPNLQELCFHWKGDFDSLTNSIDCFGNVQRVFFNETTSKQILEVVRHAAKVKEIKAKSLKEGIHFKDNILDVAALNNTRKELAGACKTTIYVPEEVFLTTKWATTKTQFSLIEIKRTEAVKWTHQFK